MSDDGFTTVSIPEHAIEKMGKRHWEMLHKHIMTTDGFIEVSRNMACCTLDYVFDRPQQYVQLPFKTKATT